MADVALLAVALLVLAVLGGVAFAVVRVFQQGERDGGDPKRRGAAAEEEEGGRQGGRRGTGMDRMRAGRLRQRRQQAAAAAADSDADSEEEEGEPLNRREQQRRDRADAREAERLAREARANKTNAYDDKRRKKEEQREAQERAAEEEAARLAAEKTRREEEEAAKWLGQISVEGEGLGEAEGGGGSGDLLERFVAYIRDRKMVSIEEVATEFGLRSTDVLDRIQGLDAMGRLTGVMDERGKFIYISTEEMQAVADYIRRKGRVAIAELAARSDGLIDLNPRGAPADGPGAAGGPTPAIDFDALLEPEPAAA